MLFATAIHFISLPVCSKSVCQTTCQTEEDELFSSLVDPEKYIDRAYDKINEPIAKCVTYKGINHKGNY